MISKSILPVIIVSIVMSLLLAISKKKPRKDESGNLILQLPKLYPIIGVFVITGGVALLIFAFFFAKENDQILAIISSIVSFIVGLLLFAKGYISYIKITDLAIIEKTLFGKQKEIRWTEIQDLSFGKQSLEMKIISADKNIKAHMHLVGFDELVSTLEKKTGKTRAQIGIPQ
ncbi:hypothetical protein F7018_03500 [Tenacibaculum aiptasiae]|uniref:Uncharacterized protein n=1 Tax=Tenacibaculum aiptasiae TaxID=426481 RepID=A0A7J5AP77_9FLAO|nr:hypothetical protein [Tenacibaculum aiptasiae]KAB1159390.1 hypothetical protein F7018_03500 [Tenacibaculum aiptasiae]